MNREKVLALLKICGEDLDCYESCPYYHVNEPKGFIGCMGALMSDAAKVIEEQTQLIWDASVEKKELRDSLKERQETIASLQSTISKLTQSIEEQPEQRHGHWQITEFFPHNVCCSLCHHRFAQTHWDAWESGQLPRNYCPHCGAKMDGR